MARQEVEFHQLVETHRNVVSFLSAHEDDVSVYLVFQLCNNGELPALLASNSSLSENYIVKLFTQIVEAIAHCHSNGTFCSVTAHLNVTHRTQHQALCGVQASYIGTSSLITFWCTMERCK